MKPYYDKIEIEPAKQDPMIGALEEMGTVISVGRDVKFCKPGDFIYFRSWGISKITEGETVRYIISDDPKFILGKKDNGRIKE